MKSIPPVVKSTSGVEVENAALGPGTTHIALEIVVSEVHPLVLVTSKVTSRHPTVFKSRLNWFEEKVKPLEKVHKEVA